jgi:hypothetical protein
MGRHFITLALQLSAGHCGKEETKLYLKKRLIKHPAEIIVHACEFMSYWAGLFTPELQVDVAAGVDTMLAIAHKLLKEKPDVKGLPAGEDVQPEDGDEA